MADNLISGRWRRLTARMRLVALFGIVVAVLALIAGAAVVIAQSEERAISRQEQVARLLDLAAQGRISGDEALEFAKVLQIEAFQEASSATAAPEAAVVAPANITAAERVAIAQAPRISRREMMAAARLSFEDAAATLLQDPDARVRAAIVQVRAAATRPAGVEALWAIAKEGGASSAAIWRASGSLMLAAGDDRAAAALENARALNPQDKGQWRLLSFAYATQNRPREAAGAALVGAGIDAASSGDWRAATARLDEALLLVADPQTRGFVLGQRGDAAAATENWEGAETSYRAALEVHGADKNIAALSLDSSKLARAQLKQGDKRRACATLRRARAQGAVVTAAELQQACAQPMRPARP